jgi:hypothetical protein
MKIDLPLVSYEVEGVDGNIHAFSGCSLVGKFELDVRLVELQDAIADAALEDEADTLPSLYLKNHWVRWLCDRCLALNGISPDWISPDQLDALLCGQVDDAGNVQPGILIQINTPRPASGTASAEPQGLADIIAALSHSEGIQGAIALAQEIPANLLLEIADKRAQQAMPPEAKQQQAFDDWKERKKEQMMARSQGGAHDGA